MIIVKPYQISTSIKGDLSVVNSNDVPFKVKRVFWINNVPKGTWRGGHAHKICHQMLLGMSGNITVSGGDGTYCMDGGVGLYVPPLNWIDICFRSANGSLLVLASHDYDESDYIRDYAEYLSFPNPVQQSQAGNH